MINCENKPFSFKKIKHYSLNIKMPENFNFKKISKFTIK